MKADQPARHLEIIKPSGERVSFYIKLGPTYELGGTCRCKVTFDGWLESPPDIQGYDSLQAFMLAVQLIDSILREYVTRGVRVVWPGSDTDYDLDEFIPRKFTRRLVSSLKRDNRKTMIYLVRCFES